MNLLSDILDMSNTVGTWNPGFRTYYVKYSINKLVQVQLVH